MKNQVFNFYATPLNVWVLFGIMMFAMIIGGIVYKAFFAPTYGME